MKRYALSAMIGIGLAGGAVAAAISPPEESVPFPEALQGRWVVDGAHCDLNQSEARSGGYGVVITGTGLYSGENVCYALNIVETAPSVWQSEEMCADEGDWDRYEVIYERQDSALTMTVDGETSLLTLCSANEASWWRQLP